MSSCLLEPAPLPDPTKRRMTGGVDLVELGDRIYFSVGSYLWETLLRAAAPHSWTAQRYTTQSAIIHIC